MFVATALVASAAEWNIEHEIVCIPFLFGHIPKL